MKKGDLVNGTPVVIGRGRQQSEIDPNAHPYDMEHGIRVTTELEMFDLGEKERGTR